MSNGNNNWLDVMFSEPITAPPPQVDTEQDDLDPQDTTATKEVDWLTTMFQQPQVSPQQPIKPEVKQKSDEEGFSLLNSFTDSFNAITQGGVVGLTMADATDEFSKIMRSGSESSDEDILNAFESIKKINNAPPIEAMEEWSKAYDKYIEKGDNAIQATYKSTIETGIDGFLGVMSQSLASLTNFETLGAAAGGAGGGAALGAAAFNPITIGGGAVSGAFAAANAYSESVNRFSQNMQAAIRDAGKDITPETIEEFLNDKDLFESVKMRSIVAGSTIGVIEGAATLLGGKAVTAVGKTVAKKAGTSVIGKTATRAAQVSTGAVVEGAGGSLGEASAMAVEGRGFDTKEIIIEGIAGIGGAPKTILVEGFTLLNTKPGRYKINNGEVTREEIVEFFESDKITEAQKASVDIDIKNDDEFKAVVDNIRRDLIIDSERVDSKVSDQSDRTKLINLYREEMLMGEAKTTLQKKKLKKIQDEISEINDKYVDSEVDVNQETRKNSIKKARENRLMRNAELVAKDLGFSKGPELIQTDKEYKDRVSSDQYDMSYDQLKILNPEAAKALDRNNGVFLGEGKILINKEVALKFESVGVAAHEILHPVLNALVGDASKQGSIVNEFKSLMTTSQLSYVQDQLNRNYTVRDQNGNIDIEKTKALQDTEFITVFSQGIVENKINYDKTTFEKIKDFLTKLFKGQGFENIDFRSGEGVFNFIKDYNKSFEEGGKLSEKAKIAVRAREAKTGVKVAEVGLVSDTPQASRADLLKSIDDIVPSEVTKEDFTLVDSGRLDDKGKPIMQMTSTMADISAKIEGNLLDGLIMRGIATNRDGNLAGLKVSEQEFKTRVKRVIGKRLKNFDPAKNDSFAGWLTGMNGALNFARQDVFKEISDEIATVSLDAPATDTGTTFASQLEDQGQVQETDFETEDLSIKPKAKPTETTQEEMSSGETLRERLGIEKFGDIYNTILDKVRSVFEGKPISVKGPNEVKFRKDLDKEFKETLFKVIKNLIGPDHVKNVVPFLNKNFDILYDSFSVRTLIDLERESKTEQGERSRKFAKRKKYLTEEEKNKTIGTYISRDDFNATNDNDYIKLNVSKKDFIGFFDIDLFQVSKKTGIKTRSGLRGTRKDSLARGISRELSFDATMQALSDPDFIEQRLARNGITKEMFDVKLRELSHIISRGDDQRAIYQDKTRVFGGQFSVADATPAVAKTIKNQPLAVLTRVRAFLAESEMVNNQLELPEELLKAPKIINESARFVFDNIKDKYREAIPASDFSEFDTQLYFNNISESGLFDDVEVRGEKLFTITKSGKKKINKDLLDSSTRAGLPKGTKEAIITANVKDYQKQAAALMKSIPLELLQLLNIAIDDSKFAQAFGQHYKLLESAEKYSTNQKKYPLNSYKIYLSKEIKNTINKPFNYNDSINSLNKQISEASGNKKELLEAAKLALQAAYDENTNTLKFLQPQNMNIAKANTVLRKMAITNDNNRIKKIEELNKVNEIDAVNKANKAMFKALSLALRNSYSSGGIKDNFLLALMSGQSNLTAGFRSFTKIAGFAEKGPIETGEHMNINAATMFKLTKYVKDPASMDLESIADSHVQYFISKEQGKKVNKFLGKVVKGMRLEGFGSLGIPLLEAMTGKTINTIDPAVAFIQGFQTSKAAAPTTPESSNISQRFNQIIEQNKGVKEDETFSETVARQRGATIGRYEFFVPPSANDFMGLLYSFLGKGKLGDAQKKFFEDFLNAPYKRGIAQMESAKQKIEDDYRKLRQKFKPIAKKLGKKIPQLDGTKLEGFTYDQAVRIYLWDYSTSFENVAEKTGLDERDVKALAKIVQDDTQLTQFARGLGLITGLQEGYVAITDTWLTDNIAADLSNIVDKINRKQFLDEFVQNKNEIFSKENLNKIEAIYGSNFREALEDILYRMENGTNRNFGKNRLVNTFTNWINNSVGAIMFFNMRSAVLQTISSVNFLNWSDNNPLMAAKAFANQPQFWSDFAMIFNSDKLKQRRKGLKIDVNQAELANSVADSKNKAKAALRYLLKIGFAPTQIADSFAIAVGGASMYRNRVNTKLKEGKSKEVAEREAFEEFSAIAEETQQSADPALISQQQSGPLGRLILAFANTPMQYARLIKKAAQDLAARRGDPKTHISKIIYYLAVQNIIFTSMQTALFAMMFDDDEEDEELKAEINKKEFSVANNMIDTLLRGAGLAGAAVATVKNAILQYHKEVNKEYGEDHAYVLLQLANISPPIGSKLRKVYRAIQTSEFDKDVIDERGFAIDSPIYRVGGDLISAATNVPADRLVNKLNNVISAFDEDNKTWQRIALGLGWSTWELNVKNEEHELIKTNAKDARRKEGYKKAAKKRKERQNLQQRLKTDRKSLQKRLRD